MFILQIDNLVSSSGYPSRFDPVLLAGYTQYADLDMFIGRLYY